ncbi:hypothetical protein EDD17DRAFT_1508281 [Pisolithus thermaeus]|nr:hypothetical protein EDD17DRAFT_1508281 [Pisolithus thermaeus]
MVENPGASKAPAPHQRPPTRGKPFHPRGGACPSGRKTRGGLLDLPQEAPPLNAPVQDWAKFIQRYQNRYSSWDKSSELSRMFPGVLGISKYPNDDEWELQSPEGTMTEWFGSSMRGHYRALLDWAKVSPHTGPQVPWEGDFSQMATMANVTAYLAANGITPHIADDAIVWAHRADPNVWATINLLRVAIHDPHLLRENWSIEWVNQQAQALGISPERIAAYGACMFEMGEVYILQEFALVTALYDLPHLPSGDDQGTGGDPPALSGETEEGELPLWPALM